LTTLTACGQTETKSNFEKSKIDIETVDFIEINNKSEQLDTIQLDKKILTEKQKIEFVNNWNNSKSVGPIKSMKKIFINVHFKDGTNRKFNGNGQYLKEGNDFGFDLGDSKFLESIWTDLNIDHIKKGQTFVGTSTKLYNCTIRINKDSTVNFIYDRDNNGVYGEHIGTIKRINDTLFHISATMTIGQFYMKSFEEDTLYIAIDKTIALELDKISIIYSNKTQKHFAGYDKQGQSIDLLKIPIDKKLFNKQKGTNIVTIIINRKNFLSDNFLTFEIPFGSAASFTKGQQEDFYVVIKEGQLYTTKNQPLQTGHFKLKMK
jgi:hypothetical protein